MGSRSNSEDSLNAEQQSTASDVAVANDILKKLETMTKNLPGKKSTRNSNLDPNVAEICRCLKDMFGFVKVQLESIVQLRRDFVEMQSSMMDLNKNYIDLSNNHEQLKNDKIMHDIEFLKIKEENVQLKRDIIAMERKLNEGKLLISGNFIKENMTNPLTLKTSLAEKLSLPITYFEGSSLAKFGTRSDKIILKTIDTSLITKIFNKMKIIKPNDLYINEYLTKSDSKIGFELRKLKKNNLIGAVSSFHGVIFYKKIDQYERIFVHDEEELEKVVNHFNNLPA
jgi:hypothetical protein